MRFTNRERQVFSLLLSGMRDKDIARRLTLSPRTVQNHLSRIYLKMGAKNRTQAVSLFAANCGKFTMDLILGEAEVEKDNYSLDGRQLDAVRAR